MLYRFYRSFQNTVSLPPVPEDFVCAELVLFVLDVCRALDGALMSHTGLDSLLR